VFILHTGVGSSGRIGQLPRREGFSCVPERFRALVGRTTIGCPEPGIANIFPFFAFAACTNGKKSARLRVIVTVLLQSTFCVASGCFSINIGKRFEPSHSLFRRKVGGASCDISQEFLCIFPACIARPFKNGLSHKSARFFWGIGRKKAREGERNGTGARPLWHRLQILFKERARRSSIARA
jgi:hypothetical protein